MENWARLSESKNPHYGERSFVFLLGDETYKVLIDEAHPDCLLVKYKSRTWVWRIEVIEKAGSKFRFMGFAHDDAPILTGTYWFELHCDERPKIIFWGDRVVFRIDHSI